MKVMDQKTLVKRRWSHEVRRTVYILTLSEIARHEFTNLWLETFSWTLQGDTLSLSLTGIILDNNLTYDQHIHQLTSSCMTKLCQINRVKNSFGRDTVHNHLRSSPKQIVLLLYSLVKHNCHKHQEASSCSEFRVQNHHKNKEIWAHNTCVTRDQMATSKWASPLHRDTQRPFSGKYLFGAL